MLNLWDKAVIFTLDASFLDEGLIAEAKVVAGATVSLTHYWE